MLSHNTLGAIPYKKLKMKYYLIIVLTMLCFMSKAQEIYELNENLTIGLPNNYEVTDTLGQKLISAQFDYSFVLIQKINNSGEMSVSIANEEELDEYYLGFKNGILKSTKGELVSSEFFYKGTLKLYRFSCRVPLEENQIRDYVVLFLNNQTYSLSYSQLESMVAELEPERTSFFSSLKAEGEYSLEDQMTPNKSQGYKRGYLIGQILGFLIILILIIFGLHKLVSSSRRNRTFAQHRPKHHT